MSSKRQSMRTTIYLGADAAEAIAEIQREYIERYGTAITVSALVSRLVSGETLEQVLTQPFLPDLKRIEREMEAMKARLKRALSSARLIELHAVHREIAELFPRVRTISNIVEASRRKREPFSEDYRTASKLEQQLHELMAECGQAIIRVAHKA